jgi:uncharacterized protein
LSIVLDSSMVVAWYNDADDHHRAALAFAGRNADELVTTPLVVAEVDHLIARGGERAQQAFWDDLDNGVATVRWWADGMRDTIAVARRHPWIGLADASLIALTRVARTERIATFDNDFRSLTTPDGQALTVLPD